MLIITQITQNHPIKNLDVGHQSFLELPLLLVTASLLKPSRKLNVYNYWFITNHEQTYLEDRAKQVKQDHKLWLRL